MVVVVATTDDAKGTGPQVGQKEPVADSGLTNRGAKNKDPRKN